MTHDDCTKRITYIYRDVSHALDILGDTTSDNVNVNYPHRTNVIMQPVIANETVIDYSLSFWFISSIAFKFSCLRRVSIMSHHQYGGNVHVIAGWLLTIVNVFRSLPHARKSEQSLSKRIIATSATKQLELSRRSAFGRINGEVITASSGLSVTYSTVTPVERYNYRTGERGQGRAARQTRGSR